MIDCVAEETKRLARSPHLRLSQTIRLTHFFVDAWATHNWAAWESALNAEFNEVKLTPTRTKQRLAEWGLVDRHGLFEMAGLTERQKQVMEARYPEGARGEDPTPVEIARQLGWPSLRVRVHLHEGYTRLRAFALNTEGTLNAFPKDGGGNISPDPKEGSFGNRLTKRSRTHHLRPM